MDEKPYEEIIGRELAFLSEAGFGYEYLYDKGSDFLDFRTVSGGEKGNFVVFSGGRYLFPDLRLRHKKMFRAFALKHLFKRATVEERWRFAAELLKAEVTDGKLFDIPLS